MFKWTSDSTLKIDTVKIQRYNDGIKNIYRHDFNRYYHKYWQR